MSKKSARPGKKVDLAPTPRTIEEITKEYNNVSSTAGACQYHAMVLGEDLKRLNEQLRSLNQEAAARNQLNAQTKQATAEAPSEA